jgi:hypothetical protein
MKEHDSTVVYYRMTQGLVPPDSPETARRRKQCDEQKHLMEVEVHRMRHTLLDRAHKVRSSEEAEMLNADNISDQSHMNHDIAKDEQEISNEPAVNDNSKG